MVVAEMMFCEDRLKLTSVVIEPHCQIPKVDVFWHYNNIRKSIFKCPSGALNFISSDTNWCQTEATVRLVITAVVGMALIIIVVDHIRLRR